MSLKRILTAFFILYTIFFNNAIQIFAENEILEEISSEQTTDSAIDMSLEEYDPDSIVPAYLDDNGLPVIVAKSAIVIDADTGVIVYEKDADAIHYPASVTKILTSLIACEETEPTDEITFSHEAVFGIGEGSSSIAVREGETLNMKDCLHAILMASANDVCVGVAEHISGTQDKFVEEMNKRAKELGAANTHFANSHGYHDVNHYTTAHDLALILKEAVKNQKFLESFSCYEYDIPATNAVNEVRHLVHKAKILNSDSPYYYPYIAGAKTGFTDQAGNTLITYAKKDGISLICCVLADRGVNTYTDSALLFDYCFGLYKDTTLIHPGDLKISVPVNQIYNNKTIDLGSVTASVNTSYSAKLPAAVNPDTITITYDVPETITGDVTVGDVIGTADISYKGNELVKMEITANSSVKAIPEEVLIRQERNKKITRWTVRIGIGILAALAVVFVIIMINSTKMRRHKRKYKKQRKLYRKQRKELEQRKITEQTEHTELNNSPKTIIEETDENS